MKPIRPVARAVVYYLGDDGPEFLLLHARKGYWQNPQGGIDIEKQETGPQAALRETVEETGLSRHNLTLIEGIKYQTSYDMVCKGEEMTALVQVYAVRSDTKEEVDITGEKGDRHIEHHWANLEDAKHLLQYDEHPEILEAFTNIADQLEKTGNLESKLHQ